MLRWQIGGLGMHMPNGLIDVNILEGKQNSEKYVATIKSFCVPIMKLNIRSKIYLRGVQPFASFGPHWQNKKIFWAAHKIP